MKVKLEDGLFLVNVIHDEIAVTSDEDEAADYGSMIDALYAIEEARWFEHYPYAEIVDDFI